MTSRQSDGRHDGGVFRSLRYRNARLFFAGLAVSNVGTWLQLTAMSLLVYRITDGDALIVGINAGLQFLPMLLLGAWAGAVADAHNRRRMSIITQSALAVAGDPARPARPERRDQRAGDLRAVARARHGQRVRQPGPAGARDRTGRAARDPERHIAEHGGDDRLADLRPGARGRAGRCDRHGVVLPRQRDHVRRDHRLAA